VLTTVLKIPIEIILTFRCFFLVKAHKASAI